MHHGLKTDVVMMTCSALSVTSWKTARLLLRYRVVRVLRTMSWPIRLDLCWLHHHITIIAIKAIAITCCCSIVDGRKKITESDFLWFSLANFLTNRWTTRRKKVRFNKGQCEHRPDQNLIATMYHFFPLVRTVVRTFRCESDLIHSLFNR